jgi:hypothetical protein
MYPYDHKRGQRIQTNVPGVAVDRAFLAHFQVLAEDAVAADSDGVALITLDAEAQTVTTGFNDPAVPRTLSIVSNKANGAGDVKITGLNYADEAITETLALNGTTARKGAKAFKKITKIELPAQTNTPVKQVETATVAGTVTTAGNAAVTVTSKLFAEPVVVAVPVEADDDANAIATAIRTALAANASIAAHFNVSGEDAAVVLTAKVAAANDTTLNIAIADGTGEGGSVGVTTAATSTNTTAGVAPDTVSVGWEDALGLPFLLPHNTVLAAYLDNVLETTAPTVTTSKTAIESNTITLNSSLNGKQVDAYLII